MLLKNAEVYLAAENLNEVFSKDSDLHLPIKINYWLQKNMRTITTLAQEIEETRLTIAKTYGEPTEDGDSYKVPPENIETAQQELNDLFGIEQDVDIHMFKLSEFDGIDLSMTQMAAIMFMIDDTEPEPETPVIEEVSE